MQEKNFIYKTETHCHTSEVSRCSIISGNDLAEFYYSAGYSAIVVTDHFLNGNTTVPRGLAWDKSIDLFCLGYQNAHAAGKKIGIEVLFGWEYSYQGADFLTYGLDENWLYDHSDMMTWSLNEYLDKTRADGAAIVHAHPFRTADYIPMIHLNPMRIDAVETLNASMKDDVNERADWYAESYSKKKFHGSDNHSGPGRPLAGIYTDIKITATKDFAEIIKNGNYLLF